MGVLKSFKKIAPRFGRFFPHPESSSISISDLFRIVDDLLGQIGLHNFLSFMTALGKHTQLEKRGCVSQGIDIVYTVHGLATIISIFLARYKPRVSEASSGLPDVESEKYRLHQALLYYNSATNFQRRYSEGNFERFHEIAVPAIYLQERNVTSGYKLLVRFSAIYAYLPKTKPSLALEPAIERFIAERYGVSVTDLPYCLYSLWAATTLNNAPISKSTFEIAGDWESSKLKLFLEKNAASLDKYSDAFVNKKNSFCNIQANIPALMKYPIVQVASGVYSIPIPKLLFLHFEDYFFWECCDHFNTKEAKGTVFNRRYGVLFEEYCYQVLKGASLKGITDIRHLQDKEIPAPDCAEFTKSCVTFFEFKSRRPLRADLVDWSSDSISRLREYMRPHVDQLLQFSRKVMELKDRHPLYAELRVAKKVQFVIISPIAVYMNGYILRDKWFAPELSEITANLGQKRLVHLVYGTVEDLEVIANGYPGILWKQYSSSKDFPLIQFHEWYTREKYRRGAQNLYMKKIVDILFGETLSDLKLGGAKKGQIGDADSQLRV